MPRVDDAGALLLAAPDIGRRLADDLIGLAHALPGQDVPALLWSIVAMFRRMGCPEGVIFAVLSVASARLTSAANAVAPQAGNA